MSTEAIIAICAAIPPTIAAVTAMILALRNGRKIDRVDSHTNGLVNTLVETTRHDAYQEGLHAKRRRGRQSSNPDDSVVI